MIFQRVLEGAIPGKDVANRHGRTPLMAACFHGHVEVARFLLEAGAGKDVADNWAVQQSVYYHYYFLSIVFFFFFFFFYLFCFLGFPI